MFRKTRKTTTTSTLTLRRRLYEKINKSLVKHGIATVTRPKIINAWERVTGKGNTLYFKEVEVEITLIDTDTGEEKVIHGIGCGMDTGDKAVMKAQTAAVKYAWLMSLQIATGDDPEADENTDLSTEEPGIPCYRVDNIVPSPKGDWAKVEITDVTTGESLKDVVVRQSLPVFRAQNIQVGNRIICDFGEVSTKSGKNIRNPESKEGCVMGMDFELYPSAIADLKPKGWP